MILNLKTVQETSCDRKNTHKHVRFFKRTDNVKFVKIRPRQNS